MGWHEHDHRLFRGTERFFRPGYRASLVSDWIPALDGVQEKLERGAKVADVGCGHGASTIIMAQAFPKSEFFGFDYHAPSIERAHEAAREAGVDDRITFATDAAKEYPGHGYDLVCVFDCLHDMGDPVGAAAHVLNTLAPDGTWMIVEPFANDCVAENLNPVGRVFYGASTVICTPGVAVPGGRPRARRTGRRGAASRGAAGGRLHARAACDGNTVQPDPGSAAVARHVSSPGRAGAPIAGPAGWSALQMERCPIRRA